MEKYAYTYLTCVVPWEDLKGELKEGSGHKARNGYRNLFKEDLKGELKVGCIHRSPTRFQSIQEDLKGELKDLHDPTPGAWGN